MCSVIQHRCLNFFGESQHRVKTARDSDRNSYNDYVHVCTYVYVMVIAGWGNQWYFLPGWKDQTAALTVRLYDT